LPRAWPDWLLSKSFFLKKEKMFAESQASKTLGRDIFFKKMFAESLARLALGKEFFLKRKTLCREPAR
jgi:hypothetical protein